MSMPACISLTALVQDEEVPEEVESAAESDDDISKVS